MFHRLNVFANSNFLNRNINIFHKGTFLPTHWKTSIKKPWESCSVKYFQNSTRMPKDDRKLVGYWLLSCCGMVSVAVVLGGITRLTESGLSMVTWKLLGEKKPTNQHEWEEEFFKYKQFPEFKISNKAMTIEEFKFIYLMEYSHRMWGRAIGICFIVPALYFWKNGFFNSAIKKRVSLCALLIGTQGVMGWYMVKSGLEDRFQNINDVPRVSQYRLASHLSFAFVLHALCLSTALSHLWPPQQFCIASLKTIYFKRLALITKGLIFITAISGAFVAGLDAGLIYNSFPKMGENWVPQSVFAIKPILKNFTENPTTVQFNHRLLGISTLSFIIILYSLGKGSLLPKRAYWAINSLMLMAWIQVTVGVSTLLNHVPVPLAAAHQSGSLILLSIIVWLNHELKLIKYLPK